MQIQELRSEMKRQRSYDKKEDELFQEREHKMHVWRTEEKQERSRKREEREREDRGRGGEREGRSRDIRLCCRVCLRLTRE